MEMSAVNTTRSKGWIRVPVAGPLELEHQQPETRIAVEVADRIPPCQNPGRLLSLDIFRGICVLLMILVDDAGGIISFLQHSPWNGVTLADFVMPFFLFIVGISLALVLKKINDKFSATRKVILRTLKLLILGILLQGGYFHGINHLIYGVNLEIIRLPGILQRIAIGYSIAAVSEIWLSHNGNVDFPYELLKKYSMQWVMALSLTAIYVGLLYGLYVPDWEYKVQVSNSFNIPSIRRFNITCGLRGSLEPSCNAVGMIDRYVFGIRHLYQRAFYQRLEECKVSDPPDWCQVPFEPEGLLSSVMAAVTCLIGLQFGHILTEFKDHKKRMVSFINSSLGLITFGSVLYLLGIPLNKQLYTFSYMCVTTGAAGVLFAVIYLLVDIYGYRSPFMLFEWMGKNALSLFVLLACNLFIIAIQGIYWKVPENNIVTYITQHGPWHHVSILKTSLSVKVE